MGAVRAWKPGSHSPAGMASRSWTGDTGLSPKSRRQARLPYGTLECFKVCIPDAVQAGVLCSLFSTGLTLPPSVSRNLTRKEFYQPFAQKSISLFRPQVPPLKMPSFAVGNWAHLTQFDNWWPVPEFESCSCCCSSPLAVLTEPAGLWTCNLETL